MKTQNIKFMILFILMSCIFMNFNCFAACKIDDNRITDRDLLILSSASYYNDQKEDLYDTIENDAVYGPYLMECVDKTELSGWKMCDFSISEGVEDSCGFSAVTYKKGDNLVIAFRGTDSGLFYENYWYLCPFMEHPQAVYAREYTEKILSSDFVDNNTKLYLTGHSLGGYLTISVLGNFLYNSEFEDKFVRAVTFNGLGMGYTEGRSAQKKLFGLEDEKLVHYRIEGDVVSLVGRHFTKVKTFRRTFWSNGSLYDKCKVSMSAHSLMCFFDCESFKVKVCQDIIN